MSNNQMSNEDKVFIRTLFHEMRKSLNSFMEVREFNMTNPQIFAFLTYAPAGLAIASDGNVDETEIAAIEKISRAIDVRSMVTMDLLELIAVAPEPDICITNEEFNIRVGSELLFLCRNMKTYEKEIMNAVKVLLTFDMAPQKENSMTKNFSKLMDTVIEKNASKDKDSELIKMQSIKKELGIAV